MPEGSSWKILMVDNDEDDYILTRGMLSTLPGRRVQLEWAPNFEAGCEALQSCGAPESTAYDAILMDYDLGPKTGLELIRTIVGCGCPSPIILFTGRAGYEVDVEAMQAGATLYLAKGEASPALLERSIRYAIERKQWELSMAEANTLLNLQKQDLEHTNLQLRETLSAHQESEERYRSLFQSLNEGFALHEIILDEAGKPCDYRFLEINPSFERLTGLRREEVVGRRMSQVLPNDDPYWVQAYGEVALSGQPIHFENYSPVLKQHYEVFAYRNAPRQFAVLFLNITARKQAETDLLAAKAEAERRALEAEEGKRILDALLEYIPEGITIASAPDVITIKTSKYVQSLLTSGWDTTRGLSMEDWLATIEHYQADGVTRAEVEDLPLWRAVKYGETIEGKELVLRKPDGDLLTTLCNAGPILDREGNITGGIVAWRDITERKQVEQERAQLLEILKEAVKETESSRAQLEAIFTAQNDSVLIYDTGMNVLRANPFFISTYGFDPAGMNVMEIMERVSCRWLDGRPALLEELPTPRALRGEKVSSKRFRVLRADGTEGAVETSSGPMREGDQITGSVTVWHDITESVQTEALLKDSNRALRENAAQLERLNLELQGFTSIASHDLQEPLRKIQAFGGRLQAKAGSKLTEEESFYFDRMQDSAARLQAMINDLLAYSHVTSKGRPLNQVDLSSIAASVLSDLEIRVEQSQAKVEIAALPTVEADPLQMRQLFQNLIGNALKFSPPGTPPEVNIRAERLPSTESAPPRVRIFIEDRGIGFDEAQAGKLFQPFQRLVSRTEYEGSGIGLAICRKIVERHQGTLAFKSAPGQGSTFIVTLPEKQS